MDGNRFLHQLLESNRLKISEIESLAVSGPVKPQPRLLLRVAMANEISVAELAACWIPSTRDWELKIAWARQAGDEARHFETVEKRLQELGGSSSAFELPAKNPLFAFLGGLETPAERIAAGMVTLESLAYNVNENFLSLCEQLGDSETARLYRDYIQPDERRHHEQGCALLVKYAVSEADQHRALAAAAKTLELAAKGRSDAMERLGTACFPGC